MKKFYLLCATACVVASASAVKKEVKTADVKNLATAAEKVLAPSVKLNPKVAVDLKNLQPAASTRAGEPEEVYYRAAEQVMSAGMTSNGYSLNGTFGFASSYGDVVFNNLSTGAESTEWSFSEYKSPYEEVIDWDVQKSSATDLIIKSEIGQMMSPVLEAKFPSGATDSYSTDNDAYLCGGSATYWFGAGNEEVGVPGLTFYQNVGLEDPEGYAGSPTILYAYWPGNDAFNANGVYNYAGNPNNWENVFTENLGMPVSDLKLEAYYIMQPKPTSTYFFTKAWLWVQAQAKQETQLISYVFPLEDDGTIAETPIAIGYAPVSKGQSGLLVFDYFPLNEDGDELEGEVFVDSAVAVSVEGFTGNDAIQMIVPVSGYYPFSLAAIQAGNRDLFKSPTLYAGFSMKADGQVYTAIDYDGAGYYLDQRDEKPGMVLDRNTIAPQCYAVLAMDAVYPYIQSVDGVYEVNIPAEGGKVTTDIDALYYDINKGINQGWYTLQAPEWLTVEVSEPAENAVTTLTISAEASAEGRTGFVTIEGIGATYSLTVNQGEGNAVSSIVLDKNAEYFDLQGRRVANPERGLYIKKVGNKAEKVIL